MPDRYGIMSDESSKKEIEALREALRTATGQGALTPTEGEQAVEMARGSPAYSYSYKDPGKHGDGQFVGPMSQDIAKTPIGRTVTQQTPDGLAVDPGRLAMVNTSAIGEEAKRVDDLERKVAAMRAAGGL